MYQIEWKGNFNKIYNIRLKSNRTVKFCTTKRKTTVKKLKLIK